MGEGKLFTSAEPKLLYQSTPNFKRMITLVRQKDLPNFVAIGFTGAAPHVGEIYSSRFSFFLLVFYFCFVFFFRQLAYRPQFATDFDVWWFKRRGLAKGCAFWVSEVLKSTLRGSKSSKTAPVWESQTKRKCPKMLNKFVITQNTPIVTHALVCLNITLDCTGPIRSK